MPVWAPWLVLRSLIPVGLRNRIPQRPMSIYPRVHRVLCLDDGFGVSFAVRFTSRQFRNLNNVQLILVGPPDPQRVPQIIARIHCPVPVLSLGLIRSAHRVLDRAGHPYQGEVLHPVSCLIITPAASCLVSSWSDSMTSQGDRAEMPHRPTGQKKISQSPGFFVLANHTYRKKESSRPHFFFPFWGSWFLRLRRL